MLSEFSNIILFKKLSKSIQDDSNVYWKSVLFKLEFDSDLELELEFEFEFKLELDLVLFSILKYKSGSNNILFPSPSPINTLDSIII